LIERVVRQEQQAQPGVRGWETVEPGGAECSGSATAASAEILKPLGQALI